MTVHFKVTYETAKKSPFLNSLSFIEITEKADRTAENLIKIARYFGVLVEVINTNYFVSMYI